MPLSYDCTITLYALGLHDQGDIANLANFSNFHGVRLIPEIDVPAHAGAGYGWTADAGLGDVVVCHQNSDPWGDQALEPPSGQLDPTNEVCHVNQLPSFICAGKLVATLHLSRFV